MPAITFADIRPLFGLRIDDPAVEAFLARFPEHRVGKPEDGAQYVVSKPLGFDLMFRPPTGYQGGRTKHLRVLECAFLYAEGVDKHHQFPRPPFRLRFADTRADLIRKLGEPTFSSFQTLGVQLADEWVVRGLEVNADYGKGATADSTVRLFTIGPARAPAGG